MASPLIVNKYVNSMGRVLPKISGRTAGDPCLVWGQRILSYRSGFVAKT